MVRKGDVDKLYMLLEVLPQAWKGLGDRGMEMVIKEGIWRLRNWSGFRILARLGAWIQSLEEDEEVSGIGRLLTLALRAKILLSRKEFDEATSGVMVFLSACGDTKNLYMALELSILEKNSQEYDGAISEGIRELHRSGYRDGILELAYWEVEGTYGGKRCEEIREQLLRIFGSSQADELSHCLSGMESLRD